MRYFLRQRLLKHLSLKREDRDLSCLDYASCMYKKNFTLVVIASMLVLSLNIIGTDQAQAATCSKYDKGMWTENNDNVMFYTILAIEIGDKEPLRGDSITTNLKLMDTWIKKTKNKKVKSAVIGLRTEFETGAAVYDWMTDPKFTKRWEQLTSMFKFNRC